MLQTRNGKRTGSWRAVNIAVDMVHEESYFDKKEAVLRIRSAAALSQLLAIRFFDPRVHQQSAKNIATGLPASVPARL